MSSAETPLPFSFTSRGVRLSGDLYLPAGCDDPVPVVVTAPGFAGVKEILIPTYAEALTSAGIGCLAFDYAGFGDSEGAPRQHVDPSAQVEAFGDALRAIARDPRVDPRCLGVWGTSLSGGHTLVVAASHPLVTCAVAIIPFVAHRTRPPGWLAVAVVTDVVRRMVGRPSRRIAVSGPPGSRAIMTTDGAMDWLTRMSAVAPRYVNEVTLSSMLPMRRYDTGRAARSVQVPLLVILATDDTITPAEQVRAVLPVGNATPDAPLLEVVELPDTHFELFDTYLQRTVDLTTSWFERHLRAKQLVPE